MSDDRPTFQREMVRDIWDELMPLLVSHWQEIATHKDVMLEPDVDVYNMCEEKGAFYLYTIRCNGFLAGYAGYFVRANVHYKSQIWAIQDVLYLSPEYRGKLTGFRFIKWCDDRLIKMGVHMIAQHVKLTHNFGPMLEKIGYRHTENLYTRRVG